MEKNNQGNRLHALDGLRGLAMVLVFLNHVKPEFIIKTFPILDRIGLFSSGVTGVSLLFILSGFLMYYLYPLPDAWQFIQKRYKRIFPLFLTMGTVMLSLSLFPELGPLYKIGIILSFAVTAHIVWVFVIRKIPFKWISQALFFLFFTFQICVGAFYAFWIMRHSPSILNTVPLSLKEGFIWAVNATLTFPFGNYIPMLDGVYWSLASEVLFYILYPLILIPIITVLLAKKRILKWVFLVSLFPFLGGIDIISHHILVLSAFQPVLFYYFATGIVLAYFFKKKKTEFLFFSKVLKKNLSWVTVAFLLIFVILQQYLNSVVSEEIGPWMRLFTALPFTVAVAMCLDHETMISRVLRSKIFVYLGTISYSLYLSHAAVIQIAESVYHPKDVTTNILFIVIVFLLEVCIASLLYFLLERPYFHSKKSVVKKEVKIKATKKGKYILLAVGGASLISLFLAFQSEYNFFSLVSPLSVSEKYQKVVLHTTDPLVIPIHLQDNNLGILSVVVTHKIDKKEVSPPLLTFSIKEEHAQKVYFTSDYVLEEFRGEAFPFGFPSISNSKGKTYLVSFTLSSASKKEYPVIDGSSLQAVYQLNKKEVIKNPPLFYSLLESKINTILYNQTSRYTFLSLLPFLLMSVLVFT